MSTIIQGNELREIALGRGVVSKATGTLSASTISLFTVAGGEVLITALWAKCTTAMTGANTVNLQTNPTTGDTVVLVTATDLGTTDTAAGTVVGFQRLQLDPTGSSAAQTLQYAKGWPALTDVVATTGTVEAVVTGAGANGAMTYYCCWVPLTDGATLVAS